MPAYVIADIEVNDPEQYEAYKKLTPGTIAPYGGKFIVRGGKTETLEGEWPHGRMVMIEFPSVEKAKEWYNSSAYQQALKIRQAASTGRILLIEGVN